MRDLDPYRSPDALIEHLCGYMTDNSAIAITVEREFGGKITIGNVMAARRRLAANEFVKREVEPDGDDEFRRRKLKAHGSDLAFKQAILRAAG